MTLVAFQTELVHMDIFQEETHLRTSCLSEDMTTLVTRLKAHTI